ncbi:hypothetical protein PspLS_05810 [Pyricularia sp. CBS 133598]|nr:hypothetical protein PspLS_05810 [Pyricularia sp. CBS 133598]
MKTATSAPPSPRGTDGGPPATQPLIRANGDDEKAVAGRNSGKPKVPPERGGDPGKPGCLRRLKVTLYSTQPSHVHPPPIEATRVEWVTGHLECLPPLIPLPPTSPAGQGLLSGSSSLVVGRRQNLGG